MKLNSSRARSIAESAWGRGGTISYKTNRKGAYYFSCSGHGGYVVDAEALTEEERALIAPYAKADRCFYAARNGEVYFFQNPYSTRAGRYYRYSDTETGYAEIYLFEEDCDWAILEHFTDICHAGRVPPKDMTHKQLAAATFQRWHANAA